MDAGGPLEFVDDGVNGAACRPNGEAIAQVINHLHTHRRDAAELGEAGWQRARAVTWDGVIEKLVGT
jgi:glycosyltransferase involved in cell wall biosynthesis